MSLDIDVNFIVLGGYIYTFEIYKDIEVILKVCKDMSEIPHFLYRGGLQKEKLSS